MATQLKDGRWQARLRLGKKRIVFYGATNQEAEDAKAAFILSTENPENPEPEQLPDVETLHTFAKRVWFPTWHFLAGNTTKAYTSTYVNHIRPYLGDRPIAEIRFEHVQEHINWLSQNGRRSHKGELLNKPLGAKKVAETRERTISILRLAESQRAIPMNPAEGTKGPKKPAKRVRVLSISRALEISEATTGTRMHAPCVLAMVLGLRRGEISALRWTDLDRVGLTLTVLEQIIQVKGPAKRAKTKTDAGQRILPLTPELVEIIDHCGNLDHSYIAGWKGFKWFPPDKITNGWVEIRGKWDMEDWHFHDLRHGAASIMHGMGIDLVTIAKILGHTKIDATLLYTDSHTEMVRGAIGEIAKAFAKK